MNLESTQEEIDQIDQFRFFFENAVGQILNSQNPEQFLLWMQEAAPHFYPSFFLMANGNRQLERVFATEMGKKIWNAIPLPKKNWNVDPLPLPSSQDLCLCRSGEKYRDCCERLGDFPWEPPTDHGILAAVIHQMKPTSLKTFPLERFPRYANGLVASRWIQDGNWKKALSFLEAYFKKSEALTDEDEEAFDLLMDCYNYFGKSQKKEALIQKMTTAPASRLRAAAWQRLTTVYADQNNWAEAWKAFLNAQKESPEDRSLIHLEMVILFHQKKFDQAKERARFLLKKLAKNKEDDLFSARLIYFLSSFLQDPYQAMLEISPTWSIPPVRDLFRFLKGLKQTIPTPPYELSPVDTGSEKFLHLKANEQIQNIEKEWYDFWPLPKPMMISLEAREEDLMLVFEQETFQGWFSFLQKNPTALESFSVLDDLVLALSTLPDRFTSVLDNTLLLPLLQRAEGLWNHLYSAQTLRLPVIWMVPEHRPLLRLLAQQIHRLLRNEEKEKAIRLMQQMVFEINPNDNHGFRQELSNLLSQLGRAEEVLKISEKYPQDVFPDLFYNKALAYFLLNDLNSAQQALEKAQEDFPHVKRFLKAKTLSAPRLDPEGVDPYGEDGAWLYVEAMKPTWEKSGGLEWLKKSIR